jgi:hypothetical protein
LMITSRRAVILHSLLSEADFFVDGKDLQTLSARLPSRAFFCLSGLNTHTVPRRTLLI